MSSFCQKPLKPLKLLKIQMKNKHWKNKLVRELNICLVDKTPEFFKNVIILSIVPVQCVIENITTTQQNWNVMKTIYEKTKPLLSPPNIISNFPMDKLPFFQRQTTGRFLVDINKQLITRPLCKQTHDLNQLPVLCLLSNLTDASHVSYP